MAYSISNQDSKKGKDSKINIINGIHNIIGKSSVSLLVLNYTNKHIMFNKGEYVWHLEATIEDIEEEKIYTLKVIQMPKQQIILLPNEWWQNK